MNPRGPTGHWLSRPAPFRARAPRHQARLEPCVILKLSLSNLIQPNEVARIDQGTVFKWRVRHNEESCGRTTNASKNWAHKSCAEKTDKSP